MKRLLVALALVAWTAPPVDAREARKPPAKPQPKRKTPPPRKKPADVKEQVTAEELAEEQLHAERLAVLGRLKEVNGGMRDAELAAILRRLDEQESRRHELSARLLARARAQAEAAR